MARGAARRGSLQLTLPEASTRLIDAVGYVEEAKQIVRLLPGDEELQYFGLIGGLAYYANESSSGGLEARHKIEVQCMAAKGWR